MILAISLIAYATLMLWTSLLVSKWDYTHNRTRDALNSAMLGFIAGMVWPATLFVIALRAFLKRGSNDNS